MAINVSDAFTYLLFALAKLVILAILLERGLYFVFDYSKWRDRIKDKGIKAPIAFAAAWLICWYYDFDILASVLDPEAITSLGSR